MSLPTRQLHEFCRIVQGGRLGLSGNHFVPEGFPAFGAGGLNGHLPIHEFDEPAVILSSIGARCGKCFYADGKWTSLANTQLIFPDPKEANARFLWFQLNDEARWHRSGTGQPFIKPADVKSHRVYLPPLVEQQRIAEILDRAEALRFKRRTALAQLDPLTQSLFLDLFGDPSANPKGWPHKKLFDLGRVVTGGTPPSVKADMFDGPIPFVTPGDLESDEPVKRSLTPAGAEESRTVRAGATLVCCIGATIGKMGIAQLKSAFNQQLNAVEWFAEVDDLYGYATLRFFKPTIKTWGASTTLPILKKSSFEKIEIPVPPLPLQQEFARRFQATEKLRAAQKESLTALDDLVASLQHRAFSGKL